MSNFTLTIIRLPNKKLVLEVENIDYHPEIYPTYQYFCEGEELLKHGFEADCWGKIHNKGEIKQHLDLDLVFKQLSINLKE